MEHYLIADIGGTNARLGLVRPETLEIFAVEKFSNRDFPQLIDVVKTYLSRVPGAESPHKACFAVASAVSGDQIQFTNNSWSFSIRELTAQLGLEALKVINDFEAIALSIPGLGPKELFRVGEGEAMPGRPMAVLGAGTGLGMAALIPHHPKPVPLGTEGGHACFAPQDDFEAQLAKEIKARRGFCANEDLLCGEGLVTLYQGLCAWHKARVMHQSPAQITNAALAESDAMARLTLERFCAILGSVAGDFALQTGAQGGVYIAGGIVPRFKEFVAERSLFRQRFESKGRFRDYMVTIPSHIITAPQPGLMGAASVFAGVPH